MSCSNLLNYFVGGTSSLCLPIHPSRMPCLLYDSSPVSWIIFICGTNTTHEGTLYVYHFHNPGQWTKVKVTQITWIFVVRAGAILVDHRSTVSVCHSLLPAFMDLFTSLEWRGCNADEIKVVKVFTSGAASDENVVHLLSHWWLFQWCLHSK